VELLLDRGEEGVEVDVEEGEAVGLYGFGHGGVCRDYIRFLFGGGGGKSESRRTQRNGENAGVRANAGVSPLRLRLRSR
jgi:hypothetical protein